MTLRIDAIFSGLFFCIAALLPHTATAWSVDEIEKLGGSDGVEHERRVLSRGSQKAILHVAYFDSTKHDLRVVDDGANRYSNLADAMARTGALAGVNGGYFHPDHSPIGLVVENGQEKNGRERASLLSGLLASNHDRIFLLRPDEFKYGPNTQQALQAGPYLVDRGIAVAGLNATRSARRTAILNDSQTRWAILISSSLTLAELGGILASEGTAVEFPVARALNLDGGSSTAFWVKKSPAPFYQREWVRVRNFVAIVPRDSRAASLK